MSEYIDADFAVICDEWRPTVTSGEGQKMNDYKEIIVKEYRNEKGLITRREIGEEIVRCKDCKWYDWVDCTNPIVTAFPNDVRDEDNYCNFGEREEQEHEQAYQKEKAQTMD